MSHWIPIAANEASFYLPDAARLQRLEAVVIPFLDREMTNATSSSNGATATLSETLEVLLGCPCPPASALAAACDHYIRQYSNGSLWPAPSRAAEGPANNGACEAGFVLAHTLRAMVEEAIRFPAYFPETELSANADGASVKQRAMFVKNPEIISWTKAQTFCLLSCAFLCLFPRPSVNCCTDDERWGQMPSINYDEMHFVNKRASSVEGAKLLMFLDYAVAMGVRRSAWVRGEAATPNPSGSVAAAENLLRPLVIIRHSIPADTFGALLAAHERTPLQPFTIHPLRASIDDESAMLRVDFANRIIGGASIAYGCVQEEISFSICPELNTARLVHAPMEDNEAIVICGAEQFSLLKPGTYGFDMRHGGAVPVPCPRGGAVLAIDAMDYRYTDPAYQFEIETMHRELCKLLAAFLAPVVDKGGVPSDEASSVATGNWGCGVFGGNVELKFILQWIASVMAKKHMHYFPFTEAHVEEVMVPLGEQLILRGASVGDLLRFLRDVVVPNSSALCRDRRRRSASVSVWSLLAEFAQRLA